MTPRLKRNSSVLILGGTKEAATLARTLTEEGHFVITSLAGRTREPKPVAGEVRIGGFGGAEGLAEFLSSHAIDHIIDATHPFAERISRNALEAARRAAVPITVKTRPAWPRRPGDLWTEVPTLEDAADAIPTGATVLLALGSQHIAPFKRRADVMFVVRMVDAPATPLAIPNHTLILGRPSNAAAEEAAVLINHQVSHIVCRNSGGPGAYAKIEAARALKIPVIMIDRPASEGKA